LKVLYPDYY